MNNGSFANNFVNEFTITAKFVDHVFPSEKRANLFIYYIQYMYLL